MILEHPAYIQVLKDDDCKSVDQLSALFVGKISAPVCYALMNMRHYLAPLLSLSTALCGCAQFLLSLCKSLLISAKESRVSNMLAGRECGESLKPTIYTNRIR